MKPLKLKLNNEEFLIDNPNKVQINQELAVRFWICFLALLNVVCDMFGLPHLTLSNEEISTVVNVAFLIITWFWIMWKNNNFTDASKAGQLVTDELKNDENANVKIKDE